MLDVETLREQFPALKRRVGGKPVVFADNAATSLKPLSVIRAVNRYYTQICANVHRGINVLAQEADQLYEEARHSIASLIHAAPEELVFVRNATEAINLAAHMVGLSQDDEIVCSLSDHHSNFLPWHTRATVKFAVPGEDGGLTSESFMDQVTPRTKLLALGHVSNVTGIVNPVRDIIGAARGRGLLTLVDGAQSVSHMHIDVRDLGCDFFGFSGHKMFGPSGIGVLYARKELLERASPLLYGGGMVSRVSAEGFELAPIPHRFEAGTPNIEGTMGMGAAAEFLSGLRMEHVHEHSRELAKALFAGLASVPSICTYPPDSYVERVPTVSFAVQGMSADNVAAILCNRYSIMVRSGVHCAEPLVRHFGQKGLTRVSLSLYNTLAEVDYVTESLEKMCSFFAS